MTLYAIPVLSTFAPGTLEHTVAHTELRGWQPKDKTIKEFKGMCSTNSFSMVLGTSPVHELILHLIRLHLTVLRPACKANEVDPWFFLAVRGATVHGLVVPVVAFLSLFNCAVAATRLLPGVNAADVRMAHILSTENPIVTIAQ